VIVHFFDIGGIVDHRCLVKTLDIKFSVHITFLE